MATLEEQQELLETIKGPHYYRITISGYGGEASYMRISKEAHDFWKEVTAQDGDSDLIHYIINAEDQSVSEVNEDDEYEYINAADIPDNAKFMHDLEDAEATGYSWYEPKNEIEHVWGVGADSAYITIEKVESSEYNAKSIEDVVYNEDLNQFIQRISEENDWEVELQDGLVNGCAMPSKGEYVCQMYSSEKGTFFDGVVETPGLIDFKKLKFVIDEAPNGEDTLWFIEYDDKEVDNDGGDTNGKGFYAYVWEQEY